MRATFSSLCRWRPAIGKQLGQAQIRELHPNTLIARPALRPRDRTQWQKIKEPSAVFWGLVFTVTEISLKSFPGSRMSVVLKPSSHLSALFRNLKSEGSDHLALRSPRKQEG